MRSKVSRKKRRIIIISAVIITFVAVLILAVKLSSFTKSLKMDFDRVGLNLNSVTVLNEDNFAMARADGTVPDVLVTKEVETAITSDGSEVCILWLDYTVYSDVELSETGFNVDIKPTRTAKGKIYSYTPVVDPKRDGNTYTFRQGILLDRVDVKNFFFEKELPRPFKGSCSFELSYCHKETGEIKKVGFHADNQL